MQCLHETSDRTLAQLLHGALEAAGIAAIVQGEHLTTLQGETPVGASAAYRVCILDDEQMPWATNFLLQWLAPRAAAPAAWTCAACGERHEGHFASCWKCGADADAS